jgi:hypothetical protein
MRQYVWKHWWKLWPRWTKIRDYSYEHIYPNAQLYSHLFLFGPLRVHWWEFIPPLVRSKKWSEMIKKLLCEELASMPYKSVVREGLWYWEI